MSVTDNDVRAAADRYREHKAVVARTGPAAQSPYTDIEVGTGAAGYVPAACDRDAHLLANALLAWDDLAGFLDTAYPAVAGRPLSPDGFLALAGTAPAFRVGDPVRKVGGDYTLDGVVRAAFRKASVRVRYVVEDARGMLLIYSDANLEARDA